MMKYLEMKKEEIHIIEENGKSLLGILSKPFVQKDENKKNVLILIPYGLNPRFGPHRIHVSIAREICKRGFFVFRFDSYGCGDNEGAFTEMAGLHRDDVFWRLVFNKIFISDVSCVIDYVYDLIRPDNIILCGICGGAIRSLLVAANSNKINGVIPIGFPSTIDDTSLDMTSKMNVQMAEFYFSTYLRKILSPKAWYRVFSFKSDYKVILRAASIILNKIIRKLKRINNKNIEGIQSPTLGSGREINNDLIDAIQTCLDNRKSILVMYGGNDRYRGDFEEIIEKSYLIEEMQKRKWDYTKFMVPDSNHEFSFIKWQHDLVDKMISWLDERF